MRWQVYYTQLHLYVHHPEAPIPNETIDREVLEIVRIQHGLCTNDRIQHGLCINDRTKDRARCRSKPDHPAYGEARGGVNDSKARCLLDEFEALFPQHVELYKCQRRYVILGSNTRCQNADVTHQSRTTTTIAAWP